MFVDEVVDAVEQVLQIGFGEGSPRGGHGIVGGVSRRVPLETDLRWNVTELLLAERNPAVSTVADIRTEHRNRVAVGPQRGQLERCFSGSEICPELIKIKWAPAPRILIGELDEPADKVASGRDGARCETI